MRRLFIVLAVVAFAFGFTVSAIAETEFSFYGNQGFTAAIYTYDADYGKDSADVSESDLTFNAGTGTFGANITTDMNITAKAEFGMRTSGDVDTKKTHATWDFGAGKLKFGRESQLIGGLISGGTTDIFRLTFGNLNVELVDNKRVNALSYTTAPVETDAMIPKISASYKLALGPLTVTPKVGFQSHSDVVVTGTTEDSYTINSNVMGATAVYAVGAFKLTVDLWSATNPKNWGSSMSIRNAEATTAYYDAGSDSIKDSTAMSYKAKLYYKLNDTYAFEGAYLVALSENDTYEGEYSYYYVTTLITLAKNITIQPKYQIYDYGVFKEEGAADVNRGVKTYMGAYMKIKW
jgi:hypothetical protein